MSSWLLGGIGFFLCIGLQWFWPSKRNKLRDGPFITKRRGVVFSAQCVPACVRRARTRLTPKANQTKKCIPGSPSQPHRNRRKNEEKHCMRDVFRTAAAAALAQEKPLTRSQTCPPCPPTAKTYSQGAIFEEFERCRGAMQGMQGM